MSWVDVVVAREAIYDRDLAVAGFELLFRPLNTAADETMGPATKDLSPADLVTAAVLFSSMSVGISRLVGQHLAFCPADRGVLTGAIPMTLPPLQTVVEVPSRLPVDAELVEGCRRLVLDGYRLALADFEWQTGPQPLLELASMVKLDVSRTPASALGQAITGCRSYGVELIAQRVSTAEELLSCREAGFDYFQGHALSQPRVLAGRTGQSTGMARMQMAASLVSDEFEVDDLERTLRTEPGLTYQLLQLASVGNRNGTRRQVRTIRDALVLVGARRLQSWIALLMITQPGVTRKQDVAVALTRARMVELLAGSVSPWLAGLGFTAGLVSAFDLMLGLPATEILDALALSDDLREAAFGDTSVVGRVVRDVIDHQDGSLQVGRRCRLRPEEFDMASIRALTWALDATDQLQVA